MKASYNPTKPLHKYQVADLVIIYQIGEIEHLVMPLIACNRGKEKEAIKRMIEEEGRQNEGTSDNN